ncbi:Inhibitory POU protein [Folsomia candida]|uniref:POU domain protein n=1 Tax=Folsomia candida TaxID=158441 RepID=A0A226CYV4_FOLCA|nr:Inhibitory POU protein [Folsomia candida]
MHRGGATGAPSYYPTAVAMYSSDKVMNGKPLGSAPGSCFPGRYSPTYRGPDPMRRCVNPTGDLFGGLNDGLLSRAEALVDMGKHPGASPPGLQQLKHDMMYHPGMGPPHPSHNPRGPHQMGHPGMEGLDMLDPISSSTMMTSLGPMNSDSGSVSHHGHTQLHPSSVYSAHSMNSMMSHPSLPHPQLHPPHPAIHDADTDPRELEAFAERFKQRRIKLGVTQADVGKALANLKLPGVGALSQSTICRFESLTLSHNNMIALKPILQAWLEEAEAQARSKRRDPDAPNVLPGGEKKRKRTSIAAPEKRSLEAYFAVQPRPSGEKIAAIAEKLDLKKNVVRVWFCKKNLNYSFLHQQLNDTQD